MARTDYEVGRVRRRAMRVLGATVRILSGQIFTDTSSGFRAFERPALDLFARTYPVDYMESVEALVMACASGLHVAEVPVQMRSPGRRRSRPTAACASCTTTPGSSWSSSSPRPAAARSGRSSP